MVAKNKKKNFVIDRSKWRCGGENFAEGNAHGKGGTSLLNSAGYMCCLGQIECQLGVSKNKIKNIDDPYLTGIKNLLTRTNKSIGEINNSSLSYKAIEINDDEDTSLKEKERKLKSLFSKWKYKLTFKGKYTTHKGK